MRGRDTIDARELVVAPGFIDLHQHAQSPQGYRVAVLDGTTTALELEGGTDSVGVWYRERENKTLINYGVSVGHEWLRMRAMGTPVMVKQVAERDRAPPPARNSPTLLLRRNTGLMKVRWLSA